MKPGWFILWVIVIWRIGTWAFAPEEPVKPQVSMGDGQPLDSTERYMVDGRKTDRQGAMKALDRAWSSRCGTGRKDFISSLNHYYYQRQNQSERYPENHGKLGADYIAAQWSTADDLRIDRLTQEAYARGYLKPSDFDGVARKMVATIVVNERVTGTGCAS
jgi:hypothetical protein